ncbi:MAG: alpha/beta hydrolase [Litorimonas sp.]
MPETDPAVPAAAISENFSSPPDAPSNEALIQLAYSLVIGPERLEELMKALEGRLAGRGREVELDRPSQGIAALVELEGHFDSAFNLLKAQGRRKLSAAGAIRTLDGSAQPAISVGPDGVIEHANPSARSLLGIESGQRLPEDRFDRDQYKALCAQLRTIDTAQENTLLMVASMSSEDGEETAKLALSRAPGLDQRPRGLLTALHISWHPEMGEMFKTRMGLTTAELAITRAVVTGTALSDLAEQRGVKTSTVRNQTKTLMKKLDVRSQTELACLYSGFCRFTLGSSIEGGVMVDQRAYLPRPELLGLGAGHCIDYAEAGPSRGRPLLFLPNMLAGRAVPPALQRALMRENVRLIMPWRPGFAKSYRPRTDADPWQATADEIEALLDHLGIEALPVLGQMTSAMYAYGCAKHLPGRVTRITTACGGLPSVRGPHLRHIGRVQKMRFFISRNAPRLGHLIAHGFLSRVDAGYDVEFIREFLKGSKVDIAFTQDSATVVSFRQAYEETHAQGYEGFIRELGIFSRDWHHLTEDLACPAHLIVGEEETSFSPAAVRTFADHVGGFEVTVLREAGHLGLYEKPSECLRIAMGDA